jgi:hypothetical protein
LMFGAKATASTVTVKSALVLVHKGRRMDALVEMHLISSEDQSRRRKVPTYRDQSCEMALESGRRCSRCQELAKPLGFKRWRLDNYLNRVDVRTPASHGCMATSCWSQHCTGHAPRKGRLRVPMRGSLGEGKHGVLKGGCRARRQHPSVLPACTRPAIA